MKDRIENAEQKQCAKHGLVVPCDPSGKIDIEIIPSVLGGVRYDTCQWAAAAINDDYQDLERYYTNKHS